MSNAQMPRTKPEDAKCDRNVKILTSVDDKLIALARRQETTVSTLVRRYIDEGIARDEGRAPIEVDGSSALAGQTTAKRPSTGPT